MRSPRKPLQKITQITIIVVEQPQKRTINTICILIERAHTTKSVKSPVQHETDYVINRKTILIIPTDFTQTNQKTTLLNIEDTVL